MIELRIYRTFSWGFEGRWSDLRIGGDNELALHAHDQLQFRVGEGEWTAVPVVEAEKPEHPRAERERQHAERMSAAIKEIFADAKPMTLDELKTATEKEFLEKRQKTE